MKPSPLEKVEIDKPFEEKRAALQRHDLTAKDRVRREVISRPLTGVRVLELILDPFIVLLTLYLAALLYGVKVDTKYLVLSIVAFLTSYIVFKEMNVCRSWRSGGVKAQTRHTLLAWLIVLGILMLIAYATKTSQLFSRPTMLTWALVTPPLLLAAHWATRKLLLVFGQSERFSRSAVIVGINDVSTRLADEMRTDRHLGLMFEGFFDDRVVHRVDGEVSDPHLGLLKDLPDYVKNHGVDVIYIALPMGQQKRILELLDGLHDTTASIYILPDFFMFDLIQGRMDDVNGVPVVAVCETPFYGINAFLKRISDILYAGLILVAISPLLLIISVLVKVSSSGPVLFKQRRYGLDGEKINVYKFRSMTVCENGDEVTQAKKDDPRITTVGKYLRRYSLDELPQFFNVLQGRMSIVGPRPHAIAHNEMYRKLIKGYMVRHKVKPGITGWAQVNGLRGETQNVDRMKARINYDLDYLRNWSLWLDFKIIVGTVRLMFRDRNAY